MKSAGGRLDAEYLEGHRADVRPRQCHRGRVVHVDLRKLLDQRNRLPRRHQDRDSLPELDQHAICVCPDDDCSELHLDLLCQHDGQLRQT